MVRGLETHFHYGNGICPARIGSVMSASALKSKKFVLPIITCPVCGSNMRLCIVEPEQYHRERMTFVCECGFDYCQSSAVAIERSL
jgi:hypothetical protein